jgi:hypothetical protein
LLSGTLGLPCSAARESWQPVCRNHYSDFRTFPGNHWRLQWQPRLADIAMATVPLANLKIDTLHNGLASSPSLGEDNQ